MTINDAGPMGPGERSVFRMHFAPDHPYVSIGGPFYLADACPLCAVMMDAQRGATSLPAYVANIQQTKA